MAHQRAGETGKPGIHIGNQDAERAKRMELEDASPSTVYSDALEAYEKFENIRKQDLKEARKDIIKILQDLEDRYDFSREELIGDLI